MMHDSPVISLDQCICTIACLSLHQGNPFPSQTSKFRHIFQVKSIKTEIRKNVIIGPKEKSPWETQYLHFLKIFLTSVFHFFVIKFSYFSFIKIIISVVEVPQKHESKQREPSQTVPLHGIRHSRERKEKCLCIFISLHLWT